MRVVRYDEDPPLRYGNPNLRWGSPSYLLEEGDEGFVAPPGTPLPEPPRPKKTFRRKAKTQTNPTPNPTTSTMPAFQYNVAPNPNGGFTTRPVFGDSASDTAILAAMAQKCGLTVEQCTAAANALLDTILECATGCAFSQGFLGRLRFRPVSGGSQASPDGFDNAEEINASVSLSFTAPAIGAWRTVLTIQNMGEVGKATPYVASIISQENGQEDHYTPGTMIVINGDNLRFNKADLTQGVFFRSGNNAEVRATVYGPINPGSLTVLVPAALAGPLTVRVSAFINGSVRSFTYMNNIS